MAHKVTRAELRQRIGEPAFSRGETYAVTGNVKSAKWTAQSKRRVLGEVAGSLGRLYRQDIVLDWAADGTVRRIRGDCTCPVGRNCKHVAAVMIKLLPSLSATEPIRGKDTSNVTAAPADTDDLDGWLKRLEQAESTDGTLLAKERTEPATERLCYVLRPAPSGALEIDLMRARLLKSGGLSKNAQRLNLAQLLLEGNPKFMTVDDLGIIGKLQHLKRLGVDTGSGLRIHASDVLGETLTNVIEEIIKTGRAKPFTVGHPDLTLGEPLRAKFNWQELPDGTQQLLALGPSGQELRTLPLIPPLYVDLRNGSCGPLVTDATPPVAHALVTMPPVPPKAARDIVKALSRLEGANAPLPNDIDVVVREDVVPVPVLRLFAVEGDLRPNGARRYSWQPSEPVMVPVLRVMFDYDGRIVGFHDRKDPDYRQEQELVIIRRKEPLEEAAYTRITALAEFGIAEITAMEQELYGIKGRRPRDFMFEVETTDHLAHELDHIALEFDQDILPQLTAEGWRIEFDESWPYRFYEGPLTFHAGVETSRTDWFSFALTVHAGEQSLDLLPVVLTVIESLPLDATGALPEDFDLAELLDDMTLFLAMPDGSRAPIAGSELVPLVRACLAAHTLLGGFHPGEAGEAKRLAEALEGCGIRFEGGAALLELGRKLQALSAAPEVAPPPSLKGELRSYQKAGYGWLTALSETGFGGVLADDMGLGKTIQALALLCRRHIDEGSDRPSLLIVPTSLIGNWQREAERFAPALKVLVLHGPTRHTRFGQIANAHLVITTYPLLHRDYKAIFAQNYELAILDEAQAVKNPAAASAKRIRDIKARQKLALTGTPIENNLQELWALYDWAVPGLLGNRKSFRENFRLKIENANDGAARQQLATRIRPFLLRRTKEQVASDLPPKTEINEFVTLTGTQRDLYETIRVAMDARVRDAITSRGLNATRITVLDALLKMRQVCCDPRLVKLESAQKVTESAKRERLLEMLEELLAEGRKVLVFSQFVEMLTLIEQDAKERGIDYALLTGQTKDRQSEIERFQAGEVSLFLISLKAGGVGLNLTAADTVILYDPWWNPAVERQAMDRAHRIGQDKPVFVYRLIAQGSVEAAIQEMQAKKQALTDSLFEGTEGGGLGMDEIDIQALFAPLS